MSGPVAEAPTVRRGNEIRSALILRIFAVERFLRALVVAALAFGVWRFEYARETDRASLQPRAPAAAQPVPAARVQHRPLQAGWAVQPRADAQPDHDQAARHRTGLLRGDRGESRASACGWANAGASTSRWSPPRSACPTRSTTWSPRSARSGLCCSPSTWPWCCTWSSPSGCSACAGASERTTPGCAASPSWTRPSPPRPPAARPRPASPRVPPQPSSPRLPPQIPSPRCPPKPPSPRLPSQPPAPGSRPAATSRRAAQPQPATEPQARSTPRLPSRPARGSARDAHPTGNGEPPAPRGAPAETDSARAAH